MRASFVVGVAAVGIALTSGVNRSAAQPLVTGDLSVYYSFDELDENGLFFDGSGNELHGLVTLGFDDANLDDMDDIRLETTDTKRGGGAVFFDTDPNIKEDYIAVCDPTNQPEHNEGCGEPLDDRPSYVPSRGFTVAAWVKVEDVGQDQAIWQSRAGGGGFIHTQVQGNGNVRMQLRGDLNSDNIVAYNEPPGGNPVPFEEWFHWAGTYEKGPDPDGFGEWAFYFNGDLVAAGEGNGSVAGTEFDVLGDWLQGGFIGLVPDFARQYVGLMDEFYLFTRSLSADEIGTLYALNSPTEPGDYNGDGVIDAADVDLQAQAMKDANPDLSIFDENMDGLVNTDDRLIWVKDHAKTWIGDANLDHEFTSGDLVEVFAAGKYETGDMALWGEGDWDGNMLFDSGDLVAAFSDGGYELGPPPAVAAVPEPSAAVLAWLLLPALFAYGRRRVVGG